MATIKKMLKEAVFAPDKYGDELSDVVTHCETIVEEISIRFHSWASNLSESDTQIWENEAPIRCKTTQELYKLFKKEKGL